MRYLTNTNKNTGKTVMYTVVVLSMKVFYNDKVGRNYVISLHRSERMFNEIYLDLSITLCLKKIILR